jgi:hypothetical protein
MAEPVDLSVPRCQACAATDCPGITGGIEACPGWQEAEARNARGEYLPTYPYPAAEHLALRPWAAALFYALAVLEFAAVAVMCLWHG